MLAQDRDLLMIQVRAANPDAFEHGARGDDRVRYVEWDNPGIGVLYFVPNDARYNDAGHRGSKKIGAEVAWDKTLGSTAVKVAHIDSGLNRNHEDFAGQSRILQGYDFQNNDADPNDESGCSWHGTHSTGTHGATINNGKGIAGLAQSTVLPIKAFCPAFLGCTAGTTPRVNALKYAGDQGAHLSSNSWGSSASSAALNDAVQYAHDKGVIHRPRPATAGPARTAWAPVEGQGQHHHRRRGHHERRRPGELQQRGRAGGRVRAGRGHPVHHERHDGLRQP